MFNRRIVMLGLASLVLAGCATTATDAGSTIYIVRHAEKVLGVDDPALTADGTARANALAERLDDARLTHVWSSDTRRTRDTAAPAAAAAGLSVAIYDPRDQENFAAQLKATPGRHLVVGHSNTTPDLARLLGGDPGEDIVEATEYDRLYVIENVGGDDRPARSSRIERYGVPTPR